MSREKTYYINKAKVDQGLKDNNLLQKELAKKIDMTPEALCKALNRGKISETFLNLIGLQLDLSPEYLSDKPYVFPGAPINYASHLAQAENNSVVSMVRSIWIQYGFNPKDIENEDFWNLYFTIKPHIDKFIQEYRSRQSNKENGEA